ncbi:polysaccharide deacetylase family protein [Alteromonas flava]|uniref:polysaccharide deacetylase family protein n=1 Tax=Alteromonas flava TaxID=2048003 RepID=UPI000C294CD6|nr:polysaccharide deacetylase family protein [Alteromonas flava]
MPRYFASVFKVLVTLVFAGAFSLAHAQTAHSGTSAVILLYHHVAEDTPASTSITPKRFATHLEYLSKHHTVIDLQTAVTAMRGNGRLPDNAVVITFDDGYRNILENAHPILKRYKMPYTIFVNPGVVGVQAGHLSWEEMAQMADEGVLFANHSLHHNHLLTREMNESEEAWLQRTLDDIESAEQIIAERLGYSLKYVAYPFGEFNQRLKQQLLQRGYIGFGQHSGAAGSVSDFGAIPRFPAAGIYANLDTLKVKLNSLPLAIKSDEVEPMQTLGSKPTVTLNLQATPPSGTAVTCFFENKPLELNATTNSFSFSLPKALSAGRSRVNCTAPSKQSGRFHWYSQPFFVADENGQYPD